MLIHGNKSILGSFIDVSVITPLKVFAKFRCPQWCCPCTTTDIIEGLHCLLVSGLKVAKVETRRDKALKPILVISTCASRHWDTSTHTDPRSRDVPVCLVETCTRHATNERTSQLMSSFVARVMRGSVLPTKDRCAAQGLTQSECVRTI